MENATTITFPADTINGDFAADLVAALTAVQNAVKDSKNPVHRSTYSSLESVLHTVRPTFAEHNLAIMQMPAYRAESETFGIVSLRTIVLHASGAKLEFHSSSPVPARENRDGRKFPPDSQAIGSAITYLRRYTLTALCAIGQEDDDGNATMTSRPVQSQPKPQQKKMPPLPEAVVNEMKKKLDDASKAAVDRGVEAAMVMKSAEAVLSSLEAGDLDRATKGVAWLAGEAS